MRYRVVCLSISMPMHITTSDPLQNASLIDLVLGRSGSLVHLTTTVSEQAGRWKGEDGPFIPAGGCSPPPTRHNLTE